MMGHGSTPFHGRIRAEVGALARTALSALMMFQSLTPRLDGVSRYADVRSVLGETATASGWSGSVAIVGQIFGFL
jgi:hypothetical protein